MYRTQTKRVFHLSLQTSVQNILRSDKYELRTSGVTRQELSETLAGTHCKCQHSAASVNHVIYKHWIREHT